LKTLLQYHPYEVKAEKVGSDRAGETEAAFWKLKLGDEWTIPAVILIRGDPVETVLMLCDEGRAKASAQCEKLLAEKKRVIAMDPFYFGECKLKSRDFLFALMVATVGERPLGLQVSQIGAVARWSKENFGGAAKLYAAGPRLGVGGRIAAALNPQAIAKVQVENELKSLKEVIEQNWSVSQKPELFCFGLLGEFDLSEIKALALHGGEQ
jgi:hypothetical protein